MACEDGLRLEELLLVEGFLSLSNEELLFLSKTVLCDRFGVLFVQPVQKLLVVCIV